MKNILVTGASGFVGSHLLKELTDNELTVVAIDRQTSETEKGSVQYFGLDLMDPKELEKIDFATVDAVIHLAGLAAVGPSFDEPMNYINTNIGIQVNLFEAALKQGAKPKFLIISSGSLYSSNAELPLTETSTVSPSSPYAVSKIGQEQMAAYYSQRGFDCIIARPFNHIGPGQNEGFIAPDLTKQIVEVEKGLGNKVLVGNLDASRDYTDVRDIVRAYRLLLEKGAPGEVYNVCSGVAVSAHDILSTIINLSSGEPEIVEDPAKMRPTDTPLIFGSHQKLTNDTGWEPEIDLTTTLTAVLGDWRNRS